MRPLGKTPPSIAYIYLQTIVFAGITWYLSHKFFHDDAYISLRYAANMLHGHGMTWNPGEHIEGYTNFLHIILIALLGLTGIPGVAAAKIINILAFFGLLYAIDRYTSCTRQRLATHEQQSLAAALCLSLTGGSLPLLAWCFGGLEGNLFACFVAAGVCQILTLLTVRPSSVLTASTGGWLALASLTRPEGMMVFGLTAGFLIILALWSARSGLKFRHFFWFVLAYAVLIGPYMAWRIWYFGEWLPNTYWAKTHGIPTDYKLYNGVFYVLQYALMPPLLPLFAFGMTCVALGLRRGNAMLAYLSLLITAFFIYIISVGGDYMSYFRFMLPVIPLLALCIYHAAIAFCAAQRPRWMRDIAGALMLFSLLQLGMLQDRGPSDGALSGMAVSDYASRQWPAGTSIALNAAGALPYAAPQFTYIDMLGLLDKHIARRKVASLPDGVAHTPGHLKADGNYVLTRAPDIIILGLSWGSDTPVFFSDWQLLNNPDFKKNYTRVERYITPPRALRNALKLANARHAPGLELDDKQQLRFVYYQHVSFAPNNHAN